eukprot:COSAG01_NODE_453_length_16866_cov_30.622175_17_plen_63_part_00
MLRGIQGVGVPHETSGAKLLGYGGALFENTAEAVRAKMEVYAADPQVTQPSLARTLGRGGAG